MRVEYSFGLLAALLLGCSAGQVDGRVAPEGGGVGTSGNSGTASGGGGSSVGGAGSAAGVGASAGTAGGTISPLDPSALIPTRVRRLTDAEFDASVQALTGTKLSPGQDLAPDARQSGFTLNDAQRVDNVTAKQIFKAATDIAAELRKQVDTVAPCANTAQAETCAQSFIDSFGQRAYRRPLTQDERTGLLAVYDGAAAGATYADGIEQVVRALINSAGFLYLTELGNGSAAKNSAAALTPYELASSLSYLVTAGPPDATLLADALAGKLDTPDGRGAAVERLVHTPAGEARVVRVIREWIGNDRIALTDKDATAYPSFSGLKNAMENESRDFVHAVVFDTAGSPLKQLLAGTSTPKDSALTSFYQRDHGPARYGILNQAAFLSVYAHATESAPVLRGVALARRFACIDIPSPTTLNIVVIPPAPDQSKTTRARFSVHSTDSVCANCHKTIDPFGFAFEEFDGMGGFRRTENGALPIDSSVTIATNTDLDGAIPNYDASPDGSSGNTLAKRLSESVDVRSCFARFVFRASAGRSDSSVRVPEQAFIDFWNSESAADQGDILKTLTAFVKSPSFAYRRAQ